MHFRLFRRLLPSARSLRLSAYCLVVFAALSLVSEHLLHAELGEAALGFGEDLGELVELAHDAETVVIDGARFHAARVVLDEPVSLALDRLERDCTRRPGALSRTLRELASRAGAALDRYGVASAARRGVLRYERDGRGTLICFTATSGDAELGLDERLHDFARDRDVSRFGRPRYVYAEPSASGKIALTSIWSDGALGLSTLFPETGDSAGSDPRVLPRPPGFRRLLSASAERLPFGVWLYAGAPRAAAVLSFYEPWLAAHDFRRVAENAPLGATAYQRHDGLQVFLSVTEEDEQTSVSLVEAGTTEGRPIATIESEE